MKKPLLLVLLALLLASCAGETLPDADWCYRWDMTNDGWMDFTINEGHPVAGRGIVTGNDHTLSISYTAPMPVMTTGIIVRIARATSSANPVHVNASIDMFGTTVGPASVDIPASEQRVYLTHRTAFGTVGSHIYIDGTATEAIQLEMIEVRGNGSNPFGSSNCAGTGSGTDFDSIEIPFDDIIGAIQEADQTLADADTSLTAPNGTPLIPQASTLAQLFGYVKWIVAPTTANSLAGPFAPIIVEFGLILVAEIVLLGIYMTVYLAVYLIRWVVWLFKLILAIVQAVASAINGAVGFLLKFVGL